MKKALVVGLIIGIILGLGQIFLVRTTLTKTGYKFNPVAPGEVTCDALSPECGYCPGLAEGDNCYVEGTFTRYRGFPLTAKSGGAANSVSLGVSLYANMALFTLGVPLLFWLVARLLTRRKAQKPKPEAIDTPTTKSPNDV